MEADRHSRFVVHSGVHREEEAFGAAPEVTLESGEASKRSLRAFDHELEAVAAGVEAADGERGAFEPARLAMAGAGVPGLVGGGRGVRARVAGGEQQKCRESGARANSRRR
jgi:hypothetical protein